MNKKGQTRDLVNILFAVAVALVILGIVAAIVLVIYGQGEESKCQISAFGQSLAHAVGPKSFISLDCPPKYVKFYEEKVTYRFSKDGRERKMIVYEGNKEVKGFDKLTDDIVNRVVAEEGRRCWRNMGEGKFDIFDRPIATFLPQVKEKGVCLICSTFEFQDQKRMHEGIRDMFKQRMINSKSTYNQYMQGDYNQVLGKDTKRLRILTATLGGKDRYSWVFQGRKASYVKKAVVEVVPGWFPTGEEKGKKVVDTYYLHLMDNEEIKNHCVRILN